MKEKTNEEEDDNYRRRRGVDGDWDEEIRMV